MPDVNVSIIIINYNTKALTMQSIDSIITTTKEVAYEIIVVDNSSKAKEVIDTKTLESINREEKFERLVKIQAVKTENNGFSNGCNIGAKYTSGEMLLFLNSDVIVKEQAIDKAYAYMAANRDIGVLGIKVLLGDGSLDHGCKRGFPTPRNSFYYFMGFDKRWPENKKYGGYRLNYFPIDQINEVDSVSGAYLMVQKSIFESINGFDESFFMYGEDLDFCFRIKEAGYKVIYYPKVWIIHLKGQSGLNKTSNTTLFHFYNSMVIFYDKHYKRKYGLIVSAVIHGAVWGRYWMHKLKNSRLKDTGAKVD